MPSSIDNPDPGSTSVRFGPAFLRYAEEKDHFELMRPIITVANEQDRLVTEQHPTPIGPIAVYRRKTRGDTIDPSKTSQIVGPPASMKTVHPKTGEPIDLILVWWPGQDQANDSEE